jgi:hypothetical protein
MVKSLEMLPYKATNAGVVRNALLSTVRQYISVHGAADWYIVNIWDCDVRDLGL